MTYDALLNTYSEPEPVLPLTIRDWMTVCEFLVELQMFQEAAVEYRRAGRSLKYEPFAAKALLLSGELFLQQLNNPPEALTSFSEALALSPTHPQWQSQIKAGIEKASAGGKQTQPATTPSHTPPPTSAVQVPPEGITL